MKIWSRVVGTLYIVAGALLGFFFLTLWATDGTECLNKTIQYINNNIFAFGITGMVLVLIGIIWVVNWFDYVYRTRVVSYDNPGGKIKISLRAIEEYINSMLKKQVEGIQTLKIKTGLSARGLETKIILKMYSNLNIPETCSSIQELTRDYLQDVVGVDRISHIEVFVTSIKTEEQEIKKPSPEDSKDDVDVYEEDK